MIQLKHILTEISIPTKISNLMRRTRFANNRDIFKDLPKDTKIDNKTKKAWILLWNYIDNNISKKQEIENYWIHVYKDQQNIKSRYK